jgi:hypothetical protein
MAWLDYLPAIYLDLRDLIWMSTTDLDILRLSTASLSSAVFSSGGSAVNSDVVAHGCSLHVSTTRKVNLPTFDGRIV